MPAAAGAKGDTVRVTLSVPTAQRLDMTGVHRVLVTQFVVDEEVGDINLGKELGEALRRDLRKKAALAVLDADPPLPEQPMPELLTNTAFWKHLADQNEADLVISGETSFKTGDRSGYQQVDQISPLTGQRIRANRFVEKEAMILDLRLFFLRGNTGQLAYEDHFHGERTYDGVGNDRLTGVFDLFEEMSGDIRAIVAPGFRQVQRVLFTE